jgi:hypothetical protein
MRPPHLRFPAAIALAAVLSGAFIAPVMAKWSHPAVPHPSPASSTTTMTAPPVVVPGTTKTSVMPAPAYFHDTIPAGATVTRVVTSPAQDSTTTTTVTKNTDGSVTTTVSTVTTAAAAQTITTTLNNPPQTAGLQTVTTNPPTTTNGVTTTTITIVNRRPPSTVTETLSTVAVVSIPPVTTTTTTTTPPPPPPPPATLTTPPLASPPGSVAELGHPGDVEATVRTLSSQAQSAMLVCEIDTPPCVADALDAYAAALQRLAPYLPPQLRSLPTIVARAAKKVRAAKTKAEAVQAVKTAIAEVHKSIALLTADDSATRQVGTREGTLVVETLQVASDKLEKAVGL